MCSENECYLERFGTGLNSFFISLPSSLSVPDKNISKDFFERKCPRHLWPGAMAETIDWNAALHFGNGKIEFGLTINRKTKKKLQKEAEAKTLKST